MTERIHHDVYGDISYDESVWTGKKTITINGIVLVKQKKDVYLFDDGQTQTYVQVKGSLLTGVKVVFGSDAVQVLRAPAWYETVCSVLIFMLVAVWGNTPALCAIVPIVGGAIGGAISGAMAVVNLMIMRNTKSVGAKLGIFVGFLVGTFVMCYAIATVLLLALAAIA